MTTVVVSPTGVLGFPDGGGHWWVYLQWVLGMRDVGCDVWWVERLPRTSHEQDVARSVARLEQFGLSGRVLAYRAGDGERPARWLAGADDAARRLAARAELLVNFDYRAPIDVVAPFRRSALVDIDPGLLQHWIASAQVEPAPHDLWFTTGETVGTSRAQFPDADREWEHLRPVVHLPSWPRVGAEGTRSYTTVTSWWGDEWVTRPDGSVYENNKRVTFLDYADLPLRSGIPLELAAYFGGSQPQDGTPHDVEPQHVGGDADDVRTMRRGGWALRRSAQVAGDPESYRRYVQRSRGEFSCVKPSCLEFRNAWVSDRTLCYLASGRPAIVQDTGVSEFLPTGEGLLRFTSLDEAADALWRVEADYPRHAAAAREIAVGCFDVVPTVRRLLDVALGKQ